MPPIGPNDPATAYPQGLDLGDGARRYTHAQPTPQATWTVNHGLNGIPAVIARDGSGVLGCEVVYSDENTVLLQFSQPTAGTAQLIF
jgi:hypothetical protein